MEIATPSNEAMAMVALENGEIPWLDIWKNSKGKVHLLKKHEPQPEHWQTDLDPKWTTHKCKQETVYDPKNVPENCKQSNAGIQIFNELCQLIINDHKVFPGFLKKYLSKKEEDQEVTPWQC